MSFGIECTHRCLCSWLRTSYHGRSQHGRQWHLTKPHMWSRWNGLSSLLATANLSSLFLGIHLRLDLHWTLNIMNMNMDIIKIYNFYLKHFSMWWIRMKINDKFVSYYCIVYFNSILLFLKQSGQNKGDLLVRPYVASPKTIGRILNEMFLAGSHQESGEFNSVSYRSTIVTPRSHFTWTSNRISFDFLKNSSPYENCYITGNIY